MNFAFTDLTDSLDTLPAHYARTPFAVFDVRTKTVKECFVTAEEAAQFAVECQQVEDENARKRAALDYVFGPGHTL